MERKIHNDKDHSWKLKISSHRAQ